MTKRKIIEINEELCNGCGNCITSCHEGALKIVNGKAKVVNEQFCDGLGSCIGSCPTGALKIIEREALEYDENLVKQHLNHLNNLKNNNQNLQSNHTYHHAGNCPSAKAMVFKKDNLNSSNDTLINSELTHWPIQLHLISPNHPAFSNCDLLIAADCTAFSFGNFHQKILKNKSLIIFCPKLDDISNYEDKLTQIFKNNNIKSITCVVMEVPCCNGLLQIVENAIKNSNCQLVIKKIVIGINGNIKDISI